MGNPLRNLVGQRIGRLTVVDREPDAVYPSQKVRRWRCLCDCGAYTTVTGSNLKHTRSCGCLNAEAAARTAVLPHVREASRQAAIARAKAKHGENYFDTSNAWYRVAYAIRLRAERLGIPFGFDSPQELAHHLAAIEPTHCPIFGIELKRDGVNKDAAPSVDRKRGELGYVRDNLQIISYRANRSKNDLSSAELKQLADWISRCI